MTAFQNHAPTVGGVLREYGQKLLDAARGPGAFDPFEITGEYAAKLRLAKEDE